MPISVVCSGCAKKLKAPDAAAGKKVRCPACNTVVLIPEPEILETPDEDLVEPDEDTAVSEKPRPAKKKTIRDLDSPIEKKRKSRDDDDDDGFDDDEDEEAEERRPRKRKKKKYIDDDDFRDRPRRRGEPHRGVMILILGILTIFTACLCPL